MSKPWRILICSGAVFLSLNAFAEPTAESPPEVEAPAPVTQAPKPQTVTPVVAPTTAPTLRIPEIKNWAEITKNLKLDRFKGKKFDHKVKIAILDNGFLGYEQELGKSIPADTVYHKGKASEADGNSDMLLHGLMMAQLVSGVIKQSGADASYELHLFNTFGYTKFADAVEQVIDGRFDLVLYSQVWEYGGNGDTKGYINALVDKAVTAGVIWINSAGNFGRLTRIVPVKSKAEGTTEWVEFPTKNGRTADGAKILCKPPPSERGCKLRLVLAWNDFKDDPEAGTEKDLDLYLLDSKKNKIGLGNRHQGLKGNPSDPLSSVLPREILVADLVPGVYTARVANVSKNFSPEQDKLRITVGGTGIEMADSNDEETLLPPADNPGVLVIGASDDFQTSRSVQLKRPDIYLQSLVKLSDGSLPFSTSNAAAMAAGLGVLHLGTSAEKSQEALLAQLQTVTRPAPKMTANDEAPPAPSSQGVRTRATAQRSQAPAPRGGGGAPPRSQQPVGIGGVPVGGCAYPIALPFSYPSIVTLLQQGGMTPMAFMGRVVMAVNYDIVAAYPLLPIPPNQRYVIGPAGVMVFFASEIGGLPPNHYEIVPLMRLPLCR